MIVEADILPLPFIVRVTGTLAKINEKDYVVSQQGVELLIFRQYHRLKKTNNWVDRKEIKKTIKRLKRIEKDLQRALEI